ncbi:MAG: DUF5009 domain-containing protein [Chthoniobacteraceae bacterium]
MTTDASRPDTKTVRLASLDAYRGFIMLLMASGALGIPQVAKNLPGSVWSTLAPWCEHVPWQGGVLWDMIQPACRFMVGIAVPYSMAKRAAQGASMRSTLSHAFVRAFVLVLLAVLLASNHAKQTDFIFTNVLGQIGLGYFLLVLLALTGARVQAAAFAALLAGYWAFFALWPLPPQDFDFSAYDMKPGDMLPGFFSHWSIHTNAAADFDRWFLNLFPREQPIVINKGGYQTLNFIPSLATMLLGLMTGQWLRSDAGKWRKVGAIAAAGIVALAAGWLAGQFVCPVVKRIWTPSWVLWSGGWVLLMLAALYAIIDGLGWRRWTFPFTVVGMNSIAIYLMFQVTSSWFRETLATHGMRELFTGPYGPMWQRGSVLALMWLVLLWLYRQRIFLKI